MGKPPAPKPIDALRRYLHLMPVWIHLSNLIILKEAVATKYPGGLDAFRTDFQTADAENHNQEDGELFSLSAMDGGHLQSDAGRLIDMGFTFDEVDDAGNELALLNRYGGVVARPAWLRTNALYAWHQDCPEPLQEKVRSISRMNMDTFIAKQESGEIPLGTWVE